MYQLLPFPMTELACLLLLIYLLWTRRLRRHHPQRSQLPPPANPPPTPHEKSNAKNNNLSPKVHLLRSKLALAMQNASPIYSEIKSKHPDALIEPWSARMSGPPYTHVVLNDKTFAMSELDDGDLAAMISTQPAIDAGENIKLYLNDVTTRTLERGLGMQRAAGVSPYTPGFLFLRLVVRGVVLGEGEE